jgi:hypothetical protein
MGKGYQLKGESSFVSAELAGRRVGRLSIGLSPPPASHP